MTFTRLLSRSETLRNTRRCGEWTVFLYDGMLKVKTPRGEKGTQLGGSKPDNLAERLLRELAAQGKA